MSLQGLDLHTLVFISIQHSQANYSRNEKYKLRWVGVSFNAKVLSLHIHIFANLD